MRPLPLSPLQAHSRFIAALCDDMLARDASAPSANRVCEIMRQMRALNTQENAR